MTEFHLIAFLGEYFLLSGLLSVIINRFDKQIKPDLVKWALSRGNSSLYENESPCIRANDVVDLVFDFFFGQKICIEFLYIFAGSHSILNHFIYEYSFKVFGPKFIEVPNNSINQFYFH